MPDWAIAILVGAGIPFLTSVLAIILPRHRTVQLGWDIANPLCIFLDQKLGKKGAEISQKSLSTTLDDLTFGARLRLRNEPRPTKEWLKARAKAAKENSNPPG